MSAAPGGGGGAAITRLAVDTAARTERSCMLRIVGVGRSNQKLIPWSCLFISKNNWPHNSRNHLKLMAPELPLSSRLSEIISDQLVATDKQKTNAQE